MTGGPRFTRRTLLKGATLAGAAAVLGQAAACSDDGSSAPADPVTKPNVIVILADDMRYDETPFMPIVQTRLAAEGVTFTSARHNISLCSPARAGFLTGQYSTRHRVRSQTDSFGRLNDETNTVAAWMGDAGYDTGIVGKYFTPAAAEHVVPGWRFQRILGKDNQEQYGFSVWDGKTTTTPATDQTAYLREQVVDFVGAAKEPFFLWFTPTAPHVPLEAPPGHEDDVATLVWPDKREDDVADKPPWIRDLPPTTDEVQAQVDQNQRLRIRELLGLDDTIGALLDTLDRDGRLARTVVIFASDNGVFEGEHRLPLLSKNLPYDPSTLVPCILRAPGLAPGMVAAPAHMSLDLTATCVDVGKATPGLPLDGVSLMDLAARPSDYADRQLLYDRDDRDDDPGFSCPPAAGVFTATRKLVRYASTPAMYELYDLEQDPDELVNVADDPARTNERQELEGQLDALLGSPGR